MNSLSNIDHENDDHLTCIDANQLDTFSKRVFEILVKGAMVLLGFPLGCILGAFIAIASGLVELGC